jgi:hypothetical protein
MVMHNGERGRCLSTAPFVHPLREQVNEADIEIFFRHESAFSY